MAEIGYKLLGRGAIFVINSMIFMLCFGLLIAYFRIFGGISSSLYKDLTSDIDKSLMSSEGLYIVVLAIVLLPVIFRKTIKELKIISHILAIALGLFIIALLSYLTFR